jgi:hypothetical protein
VGAALRAGAEGGGVASRLPMLEELVARDWKRAVGISDISGGAATPAPAPCTWLARLQILRWRRQPWCRAVGQQWANTNTR